MIITKKRLIMITILMCRLERGSIIEVNSSSYLEKILGGNSHPTSTRDQNILLSRTLIMITTFEWKLLCGKGGKFKTKNLH